MTKIGNRDAARMVQQAMTRLEATAEGKQSVRIADIQNPDLRALAEAATTGSGDRVTLTKLKQTLDTIGSELRGADFKSRGGDGDGKLDFAEIAKLSPLAARMLDWAVDGRAISGDSDPVMFVQTKDIDEAARWGAATLRKGLPPGRGKVTLDQVRGSELLQTLLRGAAERIADEAPTQRRRVASGCGGSSYVDVRTVEPDDVLKAGVPRARLREVLADAVTCLKNDITFQDPRDGSASIGNQRDEVHGYSADRVYGAGTSDTAVLLFEQMALEAKKGNMRPSQDDLTALDTASTTVSSGC